MIYKLYYYITDKLSTKIYTFLNRFYSEFDADSEYFTLYRFTSIFWEKFPVKVWSKSFFGPNRLVLTGTGPVILCIYRKCLLVPVSAGFAERNCCILDLKFNKNMFYLKFVVLHIKFVKKTIGKPIYLYSFLCVFDIAVFDQLFFMCERHRPIIIALHVEVFCRKFR